MAIRSKSYSANENRTRANRDGYEPCALCGCAVSRANKQAFDVMVTDGGYVATTEEDPDNPGWLGLQAIGPDCARRYPELQPYLLKRGS